MKKLSLNTRHLAVIATILPLAFAGPLGRLALNLSATPLIIAFWRLLFSVIGTVFFAGLSKTPREALPLLTRSQVVRSLLAGLFLAGHYLCWYAALDRTTLFNVTVFGALQPFFTLAGGWLLYRNKIRGKAIPGLVLMTGGAVVMGLMSLKTGGQASFSGDLLALMTALFFSAYLLLGQSIRQHLPAALYMVLLYGSCTVYLFLAALLTGQSLIPADLRVIGICALLTLSATFLVHSVYNWSVSHVGALFITVITLTEPIGATLIGWVLFRESPTPVALLGGLLLMGGIGWFLSRQYAPTRPGPKPSAD